MSKTSIGAMKYIPTLSDFISLVGISLMLFFVWRRPASAYSSSAALSFWPSMLVLSTMYLLQSGLLHTRSLIRVTQQSIRRSHYPGLASTLLLMLMDWASYQTRLLTLLFFCCIVQPPFSCQIPWFVLQMGSLQHPHSRPRGRLVMLPSGMYRHLWQLILATRRHDITF